MFKILSGIWFLDILNLLKYQGVDVFDSILNIDPGVWWIYFGFISLLWLTYFVLKYHSDKRK